MGTDHGFTRDLRAESTRHKLCMQLPRLGAQSWSLEGYSRAADATAFWIPEMTWAFDAGMIVAERRPSAVFLSHTHSDHVHMLTHLKSRRKPPMIYAPQESVALIEGYFQTAQALTDNAPFDPARDWQKAYELVGVQAGDRLEFGRGSARFEVEVLDCDHSVPCRGYRIMELREKLMESWRGRPGNEIAAARAAGEEVMERRAIDLLCYLGDTTEEVFTTHPQILEAPMVIVECSFFEAEHLETAAKTRHMHWARLEPIIEANPQTLFVLIHFSHRYNVEWLQGWARRCPYNNILCWLGD